MQRAGAYGEIVDETPASSEQRAIFDALNRLAAPTCHYSGHPRNFLTATPAQISKKSETAPLMGRRSARATASAHLAMLMYFPLTTFRIAVMPVPSRTSSMVIGPATPGKSLRVPRHWRILSRSLSRSSGLLVMPAFSKQYLNE